MLSLLMALLLLWIVFQKIPMKADAKHMANLTWTIFVLFIAGYAIILFLMNATNLL